MNRKQRRILEKTLRTKSSSKGPLGEATKSIQAAVAKLDKVGDLDETILGIRQAMGEVNEALTAAAADFTALQEELQTQRELTIRLLTILAGQGMSERDLNAWGDSDLEIVRALEASLREKYLAAQRDQ